MLVANKMPHVLAQYQMIVGLHGRGMNSALSNYRQAVKKKIKMIHSEKKKLNVSEMCIFSGLKEKTQLAYISIYSSETASLA